MSYFWNRTEEEEGQQPSSAAKVGAMAVLNAREEELTVLHPEVWGPHYWFFLHTVAFKYPDFPSETTRRKHYDLVSNLPLFIPVAKMGDDFADLLDQFPVAPYLLNRESFMRWVNFVHNRYNEKLHDKPSLPMYESVELYLSNYAQPLVKAHRDTAYVARVLYLLIFLFLIAVLLCLLFGPPRFFLY